MTQFLIDREVLDISAGAVIGFAVETGCQYRRSVSFPGDLDLGLRVGYLGGSSVRYEIGIFDASGNEPAAVGFLVHVYVDRDTGRPVSIPERLRGALAEIHVPSQ